jgi:LacI family transcriptional regulator
MDNRGIPVIIINNLTYIDKFTTIGVDDFQGAYIGAKHLLKLGHKNILFVDYKRDAMPSIVDDRFYGLLKPKNEAGAEQALYTRLTVLAQKGVELTEKLSNFFSGNERPTAIFAHDDYLALHIITALDELGIRVPDNVSIIAPGDVLDYSEPFIPGITTMKIDTSLLGKIAADAMIKRLNNKDENEPYSLRIKQHLVERSSCIPLTSTDTP